MEFCYFVLFPLTIARGLSEEEEEGVDGQVAHAGHVNCYKKDNIHISLVIPG